MDQHALRGRPQRILESHGQRTNPHTPHLANRPHHRMPQPRIIHQDHTDAENASPAKGTTPMGSMYNVEKMIESIYLQLEIICKTIGIEPIPMPNDENYDIQAIQEQLDPDA